MTGPATLLAAAEATLSGISAHRARTACWFTRSALEQVVDDLLRARDVDPGGASMRSRLTCLQVAYDDDPALVTSADYAWARLSQACHYHAYELSPTAADARDLVAQVARLRGALDR